MYTLERHEEIMNLLEDKKSISVVKLAELLHVSMPTIRRDLSILEEHGKVHRTHGGVVLRRSSEAEIPLMFREDQNAHAKQIIAQKAAPLIHDGDVISLGKRFQRAVFVNRLAHAAHQLLVQLGTGIGECAIALPVIAADLQKQRGKRRGNLLLLGEENKQIPAAELEHCIRESLENLRLGGVFTLLNSWCSGMLPVNHVVAVYDFYENLAERLLEKATAFLVNLKCEDGSITANIQTGCSEEIAEQAFAGLTFPHGSFRYEVMENDVVVSLATNRGGANDDEIS